MERSKNLHVLFEVARDGVEVTCQRSNCMLKRHEPLLVELKKEGHELHAAKHGKNIS
jgi:hypothetical protein